MTNHSAAPAAPHSADALKQDDCRAEFESWALAEKVAYRDEQHGICFYDGSARAHQWIGWQAAWNRRPTPASDLCADLNAERINTTPASPSLDNEAAARLRKQAEEAKKVRGVVALSPEDAFALLDCLERAEAKINYERKPDDSQQWAQLDGAVAWHLIDRHADDWSEVGNMMESWLAARMKRAEAAAGAVPEGMVDDALAKVGELGTVGAMKWLATRIAAAPPAQGLPAAPKKPYLSKFATLEEYKAAMREYEAATTPAAAPETCQCPDCLTTGLHASGCAVHNAPAYPNGPCDCRAPAAAPSEPTINQMCERKTDHIMERDAYVKTGYVLRKPGADREVCVSDGGAVSWFTLDQWNWLMFNRDHVEFAWPKPHGAAPSITSLIEQHGSILSAANEQSRLAAAPSEAKPVACVQQMRQAGLAAPRTCPTCRLGPCQFEGRTE